jgi:transcriptional regulator with XRE-family HTH domain
MAPAKTGLYEFDPSSIRVIRQKLNLKQSDLAAILDMPKTTISRWETGETTPDAKSLAAIYSAAVQGGVMPEFFKKSSNKGGRTRLIVSWDFQNWRPTSFNLKETSNLIKKTLSDRFSSTTYSLFKLFTTSSASGIMTDLSQWLSNSLWKSNADIDKIGWRVYEYPQNIDDELDAQSYSDCLQDPEDTVFVLISRDGDFVDLLQDLREKGVSTHIIAPEGTSQKLIETVGQRRRIHIPGIG